MCIYRYIKLAQRDKSTHNQMFVQNKIGNKNYRKNTKALYPEMDELVNLERLQSNGQLELEYFPIRTDYFVILY